ncbi:MAG TPA: hypothetical protein VED40_10520 [Azospirillaceae bacterium]|nr:hypothetical protein [Azospirillaceae bacterium]
MANDVTIKIGADASGVAPAARKAGEELSRLKDSAGAGAKAMEALQRQIASIDKALSPKGLAEYAAAQEKLLSRKAELVAILGDERTAQEFIDRTLAAGNPLRAEAVRQQEALREEIERLAKLGRTPVEAYADEMERLNRLLAAGKINQEDFNRAAGGLDRELMGDAKRRAAAALEQFDRDAADLDELVSGGRRKKIDREAARFGDVLADAIVQGSEGGAKAVGAVFEKSVKSAMAAAVSTAMEDAYHGLREEMDAISPKIGETIGQALTSFAVAHGAAKLLGRSDAQARNAGIGAAVGQAAGTVLPGGPEVWRVIGSFVGGLFGPGKSVGPVGQVYFGQDRMRAGDFLSINSVGTDNGADRGATSKLGNDAKALFNALVTGLGASNVNFGKATVPGFMIEQNKDGYATQLNGVRKTFQTLEDALADFVTRALDLATGLEGAMPGADAFIQALQGKSLEEVQRAIDGVRQYRDLVKPPEQLGPYAQQVRELNAAYEEGRRFATEYRLDLTALRTEEESRRAALRRSFDDDIELRLLDITDPTQAALRRLDREFEQLRAEATATGGDLDRLNRLYQLQRTAIVGLDAPLRDLADRLDGAGGAENPFASAARGARTLAEQLRGLRSGLVDASAAMMTGELSPLSAADRLVQAQRQLDQVGALAAGGNAAAMRQLPELGRSTLELARQVLGSGEAYATLFEKVLGYQRHAADVAGEQAAAEERRANGLEGGARTYAQAMADLKQAMLDGVITPEERTRITEPLNRVRDAMTGLLPPEVARDIAGDIGTIVRAIGDDRPDAGTLTGALTRLGSTAAALADPIGRAEEALADALRTLDPLTGTPATGGATTGPAPIIPGVPANANGPTAAALIGPAIDFAGARNLGEILVLLGRMGADRIGPAFDFGGARSASDIFVLLGAMGAQRIGPGFDFAGRSDLSGVVTLIGGMAAERIGPAFDFGGATSLSGVVTLAAGRLFEVIGEARQAVERAKAEAASATLMAEAARAAASQLTAAPPPLSSLAAPPPAASMTAMAANSRFEDGRIVDGLRQIQEEMAAARKETEELRRDIADQYDTSAGLATRLINAVRAPGKVTFG